MRVGTEWLIDASGCAPETLRDAAGLELVCRSILDELELAVIGEGRWHRFSDPGGVTGLYLLTESHLAVHTYPEHRVATFNLYCCRERPAWPWRSRLREALGAERIRIRRVARGGAEPTRRRVEQELSARTRKGGLH
jgi:S-adenosylmethionine decarboxylase